MPTHSFSGHTLTRHLSWSLALHVFQYFFSVLLHPNIFNLAPSAAVMIRPYESHERTFSLFLLSLGTLLFTASDITIVLLLRYNTGVGTWAQGKNCHELRRHSAWSLWVKMVQVDGHTPLLCTVTAGPISSRCSVVTDLTVVRVTGHGHAISLDMDMETRVMR